MNSESVYLYEFEHVLSFDPWGTDFPECVGKVCHGSGILTISTDALEIPFVFGNFEPYTITTNEEQLSEWMMTYWINFVTTGDPNTPNPVPVTWSPYGSSDQTMAFDYNITMVEGFRSTYCDFWNSIGYNFGF